MDGMENLTTTEESTVDTSYESADVEESSVEDAEVAEPQESQETTEATEQEPEQQTVDVNAIAAAARRKSEAEMRARDAEYARRFGHLKNPKTGQPIRSERD